MGWWLKLDTDIKKHWLWDKKPFSKGQAWIDLLLLAETYTHDKLWRGNLVTFKRGDVCRSIESLAERWGWNRKSVRRFLTVLESDQMLSLNVSKSRTTITIVNYDKFQDRGTSDGTSKGTSDGTSDESSKRTSKGTYYKNNKSNKNNRVKEKEKEPPLSEEEKHRRMIERQREEEDARIRKILHIDPNAVLPE